MHKISQEVLTMVSIIIFIMVFVNYFFYISRKDAHEIEKYKIFTTVCDDGQLYQYNSSYPLDKEYVCNNIVKIGDKK